MPEENVTQKEYKNHKDACSKSFDAIHDKLGKIDERFGKFERAMYGEEKNKVKGVLTMTTEMYDSMRLAKGGRAVFWTSTKIATGVSVIIGAFYLIVDFIKKILAN